MNLVTLKNLSELRNFSRPTKNWHTLFIKQYPVLAVQTLGYRDIGDQGGLVWILDEQDDTSLDNYPFVVVGADDARWKPYRLEYLTPQMFGALGNGLDDDSGSIQAAINAAKSEWQARNGMPSVWLRNGIILKIHGRYGVGRTLLIDENINIDADATLLALNDFLGESILKFTKRFNIIGKISLLGNIRKSPSSAIIASDIGFSTFPDLYIDSFSGFAIDILPEGNNNSVSVSRIVAARCGEGNHITYTKISDNPVDTERNKDSNIQRSRIQLDSVVPKHIEFLIYQEKIYKVVEIIDESNSIVEVFPYIPATTGSVKCIAGGVLRINTYNDNNIWNIRSIEAVGCPGIVFISRGLYGATVQKFSADVCGGGITFGTFPNQLSLNSSVNNPYIEGVDIPFLLENDVSSVTFIEPHDNSTNRQLAYKKLHLVNNGFTKIRKGELSGYPMREVDIEIREIITFSGQKLFLTNKKNLEKTLPIKINDPWTESYEVNIFLENIGKATLTFSMVRSSVGKYTIEGQDEYIFTLPQTGRHQFKLILKENDFKIF